MKRVFIAGSTGSIGENTLSCIRYLNAQARNNRAVERFKVVGLSARRQGHLLAKQVLEFSPQAVSLESPQAAKAFYAAFSSPFFSFHETTCQALAAVEYDLFVNALSGSAGLSPTVAAIESGAKILLANKETLVMAGAKIKAHLSKYSTSLIPIDSEHAALFQLLKSRSKSEVSQLILTASGGPFWNSKRKFTASFPTVEEALAHPRWKMGKKISIDSATMMNKGLEVIEAHYLFAFPYSKLKVLIHPQSLVHALIETVEGGLYAHLGLNDMRLPIQNALTAPAVCANALERVPLFSGETALQFYPPDLTRFPLLALAYECGASGEHALATLNAANEAAVQLFLAEKIPFKSISNLVRQTLQNHSATALPDFEALLALDREVKQKVLESV